MKNLKQKLNAKNVRAIINRPNGITLIALVITIVVLLILASVAINITVGENGIFNRAIQAKEQFEMAAVKEKLNLAILEVQTGEAIAGDDLTLDMMLTSLQEKLPGVEITKDGETLKGTLDGYDFVIDSDFKVTIEGYNEEAGNGGSEDEEEDVPTPPQVTTYTVTVSGSNVTSSGASSVEENTSYTTTLTAAEGYKIATVEVKMGETTLTGGTHYTYENGTITIASVTGNLTITVTAYQTVASQTTSATTADVYYASEKTLIDSSGNIVKVPAGFKVAKDSGINVTEGIVIEDNDIVTGKGNNRGNQYVWIPVGEDIKKENQDGTITTVDITLGRYRFATEGEVVNGTTLTKGTPILVQNINDYTNQSSAIQITGWNGSLFYEDIEQRAGTASSGTNGKNATALSILNFKNSVASKHGYYIARYEASYGTDGKANSKVSNSAGTSVPTTEGTLWNNITQINAAIASRGLYNNGVTSDLTNSYAWDTAIVYIQAFSNDTDYSYQTSINRGSAPSNTGENTDEVCKINDMASNVTEWTTEYCAYSTGSYAYPCTGRGGGYAYSSYSTSYRNFFDATNSGGASSAFRPTLYW